MQLRRLRMPALAALAAGAMLTACSSIPDAGSPSAPAVATATSPPATMEPAITIDRPAEGETVSVPFTVSGRANTFEAALTVDAVDASGLVACVRQVMATSGSGTPGTWEAVLAFPPEVDALPVMLRAYDHSPKDGSIADLVQIPITVGTVRPPILLTSPTCGQTYEAGGLVSVSGLATVFEAALTVDLRDSAGTTVLSQPVTAEACCEPSNFSSWMTLPDGLHPGLYDVVAFSLSPKDGRVENEFPVQIEVRG